MPGDLIVVDKLENEFGKALLYSDPDAENPRSSENLGTMVCWHRRYVLGDKHSFQDPWDFDKNINRTEAVVLPLYLYDHSGLSISTTPFSCPWDSGRAGYIYATKADIRKWFGVKRVTKRILDLAKAELETEVAVYNDYLSGEIYGYSLEDKNGNEKDSLWGIYGLEKAKELALEAMSALATA